jgi:hypothetical protein
VFTKNMRKPKLSARHFLCHKLIKFYNNKTYGFND